MDTMNCGFSKIISVTNILYLWVFLVCFKLKADVPSTVTTSSQSVQELLVPQ